MTNKMRIRIVDALPIYVDTAEIAKVKMITEEKAVDWYKSNQQELMELLQERYEELVKYWDV